MKTTTAPLEPITRKPSSEPSARPACIRWVESLLVLLALVGSVVYPLTHRQKSESRALSAQETAFANEGIRYRDAEAGTFLVR